MFQGKKRRSPQSADRDERERLNPFQPAYRCETRAVVTLRSSLVSHAWMRPGFARTKTSRRWPFQSDEIHNSSASTTDIAPPNRIVGAGMAYWNIATVCRRPSGHSGSGKTYDAPFRANAAWLTGIRPADHPNMLLVSCRYASETPHLGAHAVTRRAASFAGERSGTSQERKLAEHRLTAWADGV